ncbi:Mss4p nuclear export [Lodderomyces elongisporus]|uniref:Mss4p nuclear export n=1 Tax=Lodderomyces elongisporus TaxID=36914 RepID=UPI0029255E30|nr:Mss4p nuclear export [Lodderomyces elongisporus]WLF79303.1 Mss4p nuclear export [Lodderomyces elongisporus]
MSKRQIESDSDIDVSSTDESDTEVNEQQQNEDVEMEDTVNVDFDFFDLNPDVDFHATKNFLRQLFGDDHAQFDISGLADLILTKNSVGTSIKTEGEQSDPFALLSVVNITNNRTNTSIEKLIDYLIKKTSKNMELNLVLKKLLSTKAGDASSPEPRVGLIVSERFINMPIEVIPPMYKMLLEEMSKAENKSERFDFDHYIIISKVYQLVDAVEKDDDEDHSNNKGKKRKTPVNEPKQIEMDYFHLEDPILEDNAVSKGIFEYDNQNKQETDSRRVFTDYGIDPKLSVIVLNKDKLAKSVEEMQQQFPPPS